MSKKFHAGEFEGTNPDPVNDADVRAATRALIAKMKAEKVVSNAQIIFFQNYLDTNYREVNQNGTDWIVVNGVPLVEGVLNGRLVTASEFGLFAQDWNGAPIVIRHPKQNGGSARVPSPDVTVVGRFYNASVDKKSNRLVGEFWMSKDSLLSDPEGEVLLNKIKANQPIEVSTGYFSASAKEPGKWKDKPYQLVDRNIHADHIALLPDEEGACSISDGCGLNRNAKAKCDTCQECNNPEKNGLAEIFEAYCNSFPGHRGEPGVRGGSLGRDEVAGSSMGETPKTDLQKTLAVRAQTAIAKKMRGSDMNLQNPKITNVRLHGFRDLPGDHYSYDKVTATIHDRWANPITKLMENDVYEAVYQGGEDVVITAIESKRESNLNAADPIHQGLSRLFDFLA